RHELPFVGCDGELKPGLRHYRTCLPRPRRAAYVTVAQTPRTGRSGPRAKPEGDERGATGGDGDVRGDGRRGQAGRRWRSAWMMVPSSSQSSSPPTGTPRAREVIST